MIDPAEETFTSYLYRPYIDLTPEAPEGNIWTKGLLLAIEAFESETDGVRLHGVRPEQDRQQIMREAFLPQFQVSIPSDLPDDLRTPVWENLLASLSRSPREPERFVRALWVLSRMCLHDAVLYYSHPKYPDQMEARPHFAAQMLIRGMSLTTFSDDPDTSDLEWVASETELGSWPAIEATYLLAAVVAKSKSPDLDILRHWVEEHDHQITAAEMNKGTHDLAKWRSRYHRVKAFVPQLEGEMAEMTEELDRSSAFAEAMLADTPNHEAEKKTLATALAETRTKEALHLGDRELATKRAHLYVELAPLDPQAHLALGDVLFEGHHYHEAITAYQNAARYGPPKTEVSNFMLGLCQKELGMWASARGSFLSSLNYDPQGYSSLEELIVVARELDDKVLSDWAKHRLAILGVDKESDELKPYQRFEGALG